MYFRFARRTERIFTAFATPLPSNPQDAATCEFIHLAGEVQLINRLLVLWGEYCRNLIIISALGDALTIQGTLLASSPGIGRFSDIRARLGVNFGAGPGTKWEEPQWALARADSLIPKNRRQIGLGLGTAPVKELKLIRNFLIHPNKHTKNNYQALARNLGYPRREPRALLTSSLGMGSTVLESWIDDFQTSAYNAAL